MTEFRSVELPQDDVNHASELMLWLPDVKVSRVLDSRLARQYLQLTVDAVTILPGVTEAQIERPITLNIDSLPKMQDRRSPKLRFGSLPDINEPQVVNLDLTPRPVLGDKDNLQAINTAFWLGVVVGAELSEEKLDPTTYREKRGKQLWKRFYYPGVIVGSLSIEAALGIRGFEDLLVSIPTAVAVSTGINVAKSKASLYKYLEKKHKDDSRELAKEYQVLGYDSIPS